MEKDKITIEITPLEGKNFDWQLSTNNGGFNFNKIMLIEALNKIVLHIHWEHVLEEVGVDPHDIDDNQSDET